MTKTQTLQKPEPEAVTYDHEMKLVYGTIKKFDFDHDKRNGKLIITDIDGNDHTAYITNTTTARHMLIQWFGANNEKLTNMLGRGRGLVPRKTQGKPRTFRIDENKNLFGVTGPRYTPVEITDVMKGVKEAIPDAEVKILTKPTGRHGGSLRVNLGTFGDGLVNLGIEIDCGTKNGRRAARATSWGRILACKNQLTIAGSDLIDELPGVNVHSRNRHTKTPIARLIEQVGEVGGSASKVAEIIASAKKVKLTRKQMDSILFYYMALRKISRVTVDRIRAALDDDDIQQVPGTLYGLAMAVTWVGTHGKDENGKDYAFGVYSALRSMGGEMLVVSPKFKEYMKAVEENQPPESAKEDVVEVAASPDTKVDVEVSA